MKYIELMLTIKLKQGIKLYELPERISQGMNEFFRYNEFLSKFHKEQGYKLYNFSLLSPIEREKFYLKDKPYVIYLRFSNLTILNDLYEAFLKVENSIFSVVGRSFEIKEMEKQIDYIYSVNPAVISFQDPITKKVKNLDVNSYNKKFVMEALNNNAKKKYDAVLDVIGERHDFIEDVEIMNNKSIIYSYKRGVIIGNKYRIKVKKDALSQKIAFNTLCCGLAEKNSLSYGFCEAKYIGEVR